LGTALASVASSFQNPALMNHPRIQARHLYLLALFQLLVGPLVLVQVTMFCTLTVRELPQHGVAAAVARAWHNDQFQSLLNASHEERIETSKSSLPDASGKAKLKVAKISMVAWQALPALPAAPAKLGSLPAHAEAWTPAWPQAPPGPPPRVG
jgi:hypothetical protein